VAVRAAGADEAMQLTGVVFQPFSEVGVKGVKGVAVLAMGAAAFDDATARAAATAATHPPVCSRPKGLHRGGHLPPPPHSALPDLVSVHGHHTEPRHVHTHKHTTQVKGELALVDKTDAQEQSFARVTFQDKCEAAVNEQIKCVLVRVRACVARRWWWCCCCCCRSRRPAHAASMWLLAAALRQALLRLPADPPSPALRLVHTRVPHSIEYNVSYVYHALFAYFDRDNVALPGMAAFFKVRVRGVCVCVCVWW
jgi:hypothetical protein